MNDFDRNSICDFPRSGMHTRTSTLGICLANSNSGAPGGEVSILSNRPLQTSKMLAKIANWGTEIAMSDVHTPQILPGGPFGWRAVVERFQSPKPRASQIRRPLQAPSA